MNDGESMKTGAEFYRMLLLQGEGQIPVTSTRGLAEILVKAFPEVCPGCGVATGRMEMVDVVDRVIAAVRGERRR